MAIINFRQGGCAMIACVVMFTAAMLLCCATAEADPQGKSLLLLGNLDYPPLNFIENGISKGVTVDIVRALSKEMGRQINIELTDWNTAQEKVLKGEADGLIEMSISDKRKQLYDFSNPILTNEFSLFVRSDDIRIRGVGNLAGMKVAVTKGGLPDVFMEARPEVVVVPVGSYREGVERLAAGSVDAFAGDRWVGAYIIRTHDLRGIKVTGSPFASLPGAIAIRKGNPQLVAEINQAIARLEKTGAIARIQDKWRPQEMVFLSWQRARRIVITAASLVLLVLAGAIAIWIMSLKRQIRERKKAEQALLGSQAILSQILDSIPQGIFWKDRDCVYQGCNKILAKTLGFSASDQVIGKTDFDLSWPQEEAEAYRADDQDVMETGRPKRHIVEPLQQADGSRLWVDTTKVPLADDSGNVYGVLGVFDDITDRRKNEEALRESERKYRELVENLNVGVFRSIPTSERVVSANTALVEIFGYDTLSEFQRQPISAHYHHDTDWSLIIEKVSREGQIKDWEVEACKKDGSTIWITISAKAHYDGHGTAVRWIDGIIEDITERRRTEEILRENEQRFRAIFEHSGIGIAVVDMQGHPIESNPVLLKMLGYNEEELGVMRFTEFTHPDDRDPDWGLFGELLEGKRDRYQIEKRYVTKTGQVIWGRLTVSIIRDAAGNPLYCIGMVDDITERQQMQEIMVQAEKMAMIAGLAAGMAHEINNPLGIIVQNLQVLEQRFSPRYSRNIEVAEQVGLDFGLLLKYLERQEIFDFINGMKDAGKRASKVMTNTLQFSRKSGEGHQSVFLPAVCDQALEMTENDYDLKKRYDFKAITIFREYADDLPQISVNISEIVQVLINLLKNAAQALSEGSIDRKPLIRISARRHNGMVELKISDNGPGMPEEIRRRVFEPFFTTKEVGVGTGLGLAVSYTIITNNHGGSIDVDSSPGNGTCFTIQLPIK
ncbi:MAG: PAS domain S-box protein [Oryzomonas sp.]|uniref:PAS domain S-box protein n=1 Tax=Oryzomonas sp. TaxID=2855186 RepID=UPI002849CC30|nr:PAS domain S-box protein [Oryzomonas sp.]MDR3581357.1 PAS domain S-box protein [Oryzomonas sp.]